jgi:MoxR-like ATPase
MEEHCITIDGNQIPVPEPFMVIGTQNPAEMAGTYPLPEAQLDRFMMKLSVGYPDVQASEDMARRFLDGSLHQETQPVLCGKDILDMRGEVEKVAIHENLRAYGVLIVDATRNKAEISCGASPRALLTMLRCAQAIAYLDDRDYCIPEDILSAASLTLPHRLILTAQARMNRLSQDKVLKNIIDHIKVPA